MCTHADTPVLSLQFQSWQKITILSLPFQGYFWLGLFANGKKLSLLPTPSLGLVQKRNLSESTAHSQRDQETGLLVGGERDWGVGEDPRPCSSSHHPQAVF